jgi:c-di-GMP-binding flagellar brake protein YcgR
MFPEANEFMPSRPAPLDGAPGGQGAPEFKITAPLEIRAWLKQLCEAGAVLNLSSADGTTYSSRIWGYDSDRRVLTLAADPNDSRLHSLTESNEITAVGYLENVKLQFEMGSLMLIRNGKQSVLQAPYPHELYRFQRRGSFRVKPLLSHTPTAYFTHPDWPQTSLALRVLDVSVGGCALFMPLDTPPVQPGTVLKHVRLELDADTRMLVDLRIQYVAALNPDSQGVRLGLEMTSMSPEVERLLIRFVDQTQRRRRMLAKG